MIGNQVETIEETIRENLLKAGMDLIEANNCIEALTDTDPSKKANRNVIIKEVILTMKKRPCSLQKWYVHDLISRFTGLAPGYIHRIAYDPDPASIIKSKA